MLLAMMTLRLGMNTTVLRSEGPHPPIVLCWEHLAVLPAGGGAKGARLLPAVLSSVRQNQCCSAAAWSAGSASVCPGSRLLLPSAHAPSQLCSPNLTSITWLRLPTRTRVL